MTVQSASENTMEASSVKLSLYGDYIQFSPEQIRYRDITQKYETLANQLANQFKLLYKQKNHSLDDVSKMHMDKANNLLS